MILRHTDNLSRALQAKAISAAEGQKTADMVVQTLQKLRQDRKYDLFWMKIGKMAESLKLNYLGNTNVLKGMMMGWLKEIFMIIQNYILGSIILKPLT